MLRKHNRWLILRSNSTNIEFSELDFLVDSDVTMATRTSDTKFDLYEIYRLGSTEQIVLNEIGEWQDNSGIHTVTTLGIARRRMNLRQSTIKAGTVVGYNY